MARRFILSDDFSGVESDDVKNHVFMVDNVFYEVDFSAQSFALFEEALASFVKVARVTRRITATAKGEATKAETIRQWAKANGMEVSERGRLSDEIVEAYEKANSDGTESDSENDDSGDAESSEDQSEERSESVADASEGASEDGTDSDSEKAKPNTRNARK